MLAKRLGATAILLGLMFFLPWWLWFIGLIFAAILYAYYYEGLILALIYDLIFGAWQIKAFNLPFLMTLLVIIVLLLATPIRYRLWH